MMELKEAIELLNNNTVRIQILSDFADKEYCGEALATILSFLSKIQDAEMPQPITIQEKRIAEPLCEISFNKGRIIGYNQCYDEWLAYHTRKMAERVDVLKLKDLMNTICQECQQPRFTDCSFTCSILANAIAKEIRGEK